MHKRLMVLATVGLTVGLFLSLGEVGVRLFVKNSGITPEFIRNRSLRYEPALYARHVFAKEEHIAVDSPVKGIGVHYEINKNGYRGEYFSPQKPPGVLRIMVYGGSMVFDLRAPEGESWPQMIQKGLRKNGINDVEVINAGIPGHTSLDSVGRLFTEGFAFKPDFVLICNGWNDLKYFLSKETILRTLKPRLQNFDPRIYYMGSLDKWMCETFHLYNVLRRIYFKRQYKIGKEGLEESQTVLFPKTAINPLAIDQYRLAMEVFVDLARNIGARPILMTQARLIHESNVSSPPSTIDFHRVQLTPDALLEISNELDQLIRDVSMKKGVPLIDASAHLSGKEWAFEDHVHLLPPGSRALAQQVVEFFLENEIQ